MTTAIIGTLTVAVLFAAAYFIKKEPRSIVNGFLLQAGVILAYFTLVAYAQANGYPLVLERFIAFAMYAVIFVLGLALLVDFGLVLRREGFSIPNVLPFFFGALALVVACAGYHDLTSGLSGSVLYVKVMSVLQNIVLYLPFSIGSVFIYAIVYLLLPKEKNAGYLVVLGCGLRKDGSATPLLRGRLDAAIHAWHRGGSRAVFVVSGGQGQHEVISEARAMKNHLLSKGVPEYKIILENKSTSTRENLLFSKKMIEQDGKGGTVLVCTSSYHVLRAVLLSRALHFDAQGIGGHTALYYWPVAFIREYIAMVFQYKALFAAFVALAVVTGVWF